MRRQNIERDLEARQSRRMHAESRYLSRLERLENKALPMVGELCRNGQKVYYVWPRGGRYRESNSQSELIDFLIRRGYVS
jgi:hypothetical protein